MGQKVQGIRSINSSHKIDRGRLKIGNGETKALICTTCGYELRGECWLEGDSEQRGIKGRKKWNNCKSEYHKFQARELHLFL